MAEKAGGIGRWLTRGASARGRPPKEAAVQAAAERVEAVPDELREIAEELLRVGESRLDTSTKLGASRLGERDKAKQAAAELMAMGVSMTDTAALVGVSRQTIYRWKQDVEYMELVDVLTLTSGLATKGERVRTAKRVVRDIESRRVKAGKALSDKDLLDWLKYLQQEQEGLRLLSDEQIEQLASAIAGREATADGGPDAAGGSDSTAESSGDSGSENRSE